MHHTILPANFPGKFVYSKVIVSGYITTVVFLDRNLPCHSSLVPRPLFFLLCGGREKRFPGIIYYACACRPEQGGVTQALAVGRSATAVKLKVNDQGHKIALTVGQGSRRYGRFETHNRKLYVATIKFTELYVTHKK